MTANSGLRQLLEQLRPRVEHLLTTFWLLGNGENSALAFRLKPSQKFAAGTIVCQRSIKFSNTAGFWFCGLPLLSYKPNNVSSETAYLVL